MSDQSLVKIGQSWINPRSVDAVYADARGRYPDIVVTVAGVRIVVAPNVDPERVDAALDQVAGWLTRK